MFVLIWINSALDRLADFYVNCTPEERARMSAGVAALNSRLRSDPLAVGESRSGGYRVVFTPLLCLLFHVSDLDRTVQVTWLRRYGR